MKKLLMIVASLLLTSLVFADTTLNLDKSKSKLMWLGKKVTGKHNGDIKFKSGSITLSKEGILKNANFTVDMTTINTTDLSGEWKDKLDGHLKNEDFFNVSKHPTSTLKFKKVNSKAGKVYNVTADLTIKEKTKPVTFDVKLDGKKATGSFTFDRTVYDIKYGSGKFFEGLGDKMINDEVKVDFDIALK